MSYLYLLQLGCPRCLETFRIVEERGHSVPVDHDVAPTTAEFCPRCGDAPKPGSWDVHEETRVERVPQVEEVDQP